VCSWLKGLRLGFNGFCGWQINLIEDILASEYLFPSTADNLKTLFLSYK